MSTPNTRVLKPAGWKRVFDLHQDQATPEAIDAQVRSGIRFGGTNLWVLICAIFIASIGLNVNSTAVIIGAMLVSPLMGPIIGIGYGIAINRIILIKASLRSLGLFVMISLSASTIYFLLSPLQMAQSELVARTTPSIWDVLIAFFGGAAGMIGLSRKEKTTIIPGVAIATALMPPLCTAGYGLANQQWNFFLGAFYLFFINAVFIGFAALVITKWLAVPLHRFPDSVTRTRARTLIGLILIVTLIPSVILAGRLVQHEVFQREAKRFIASINSKSANYQMLGQAIDPEKREIVLVLGTAITEEEEQHLRAQFSTYKLDKSLLTIKKPGQQTFDLKKIKHELEQDMKGELTRDSILLNESQLARIAKLELALKDRDSNEEKKHAQIANEIKVLHPKTQEVLIGSGVLFKESTPPSAQQLLVLIKTKEPLTSKEIGNLAKWLEVRYPDTKIRLIVESERGQRR